MAQGYIKLYRAIVQSEIYSLPPLYLRVFERLIIEANHEECTIPYRYKGKVTDKTIKRGERLTNLRAIGEWVGWYERGVFKIPNPKLIKEIIDYLVENNMIEIVREGQEEQENKSNRNETHYRIVNYEVYQDKKDSKVTEEKQDRNRIETEKKLNNNDKEYIKNDKNENNSSSKEKNKKRKTPEVTEEEVIKFTEEYTDNEELRKTITAFINHRASRSEPLTAYAVGLLLKSLTKYGKSDEQKIEMLNNSILNNWKGVFPLKDNQKPTYQKPNNFNNYPQRPDSDPNYVDRIEQAKLKQADKAYKEAASDLDFKAAIEKIRGL
jgi:hypothetical protein